jgi:hypothetical protein
MEPNKALPVNSHKYLDLWTHDRTLNNLEWHLNKTYKQLKEDSIEKTIGDRLACIFSYKYVDPGHIKRIDYVKHIEHSFPVDVWGYNRNYKSFKGSLPYRQKDVALWPYKYTFTAENHAIKNYATEKIIDSIMSECLCFYWGCPNLEEWINPDCFVRLDLENFDQDFTYMKECIDSGLWEQRIDIIRKEKQRLLREMVFPVRLEKILS